MLKRVQKYAMAGKKGTFYWKSLIWFLFTTSIPGLIIGGCIYWFAVGSIEKGVSELHQKQIAERAQNIDDQMSSVELDISHWAFNPRFGSNLKDFNFVYYFKETWDVTKTLFMLQGSHPLIEEVQLFIDRDKPVLFKPEYYELKDNALVSGFERLIEEGRNIYWTNRLPAPASATPPVNAPIVLIHKIPGDSTAPFGVIVVSLKRDKVMNLLKTMTPYNEGLTLLLDKEGRVIVSDDSDEKAISGAIKSEVMRRNEPAGTFLFTSDGVTYSVSYGTMKRISSDWTYISAAPMTSITSPVVAVSNMIITISASGVLLALLLSWLASRRVYSPVERLMKRLSGDKTGAFHPQAVDEFQFLERQWNHLTNESLSLRNRLDEQRSHVRAGFLLQLLQGHLNSYSEHDLKERVKLYGWNVDDHVFHIVHIQLTGYDVLTERFAHGDESLVTFAASNIIEELSAERFEQFSVVNFHDLTVGLLVMSPSDTPVSERLHALGEEITKAVNRIIKMQVTITISGKIGGIRHVPDMFIEVERATGYRKFVNQNQLIDMEHLPTDSGTDEIGYPFALERDVIHAMRNGNREEAERLITLFLEESRSGRGTEIHVQQSMLQLLGSIQHAILQSGTSTRHLFHGENMFAQLSQIREPDKMLHWMKEKVVVPFIEERDAKANSQMKRMVENTVDYIHAHYAEDISLDGCADLVGTSPYTLSKLFKQVTGVNFIDYVTELRIAQAKKLLCETDRKINDIALQVGYQQRYFNRIFKKQVGVTPGQYREQAEA
ncbi:AraC family transcriptional regulator [Paenibacillus antri]|uniref:AraC family transcriptional regulator n=1 Tax=Paenibacillus antri TaxID=2582848 RepID=A0A5R9G689_9BACL|nr:AraC family transcriptional regulator [Paenibacillus antri]TLS49620.1 AraC family transcriptional regulator [Paenibacillus antri]